MFEGKESRIVTGLAASDDLHQLVSTLYRRNNNNDNNSSQSYKIHIVLFKLILIEYNNKKAGLHYSLF